MAVGESLGSAVPSVLAAAALPLRPWASPPASAPRAWGAPSRAPPCLAAARPPGLAPDLAAERAEAAAAAAGPSDVSMSAAASLSALESEAVRQPLPASEPPPCRQKQGPTSVLHSSH